MGRPADALPELLAYRRLAPKEPLAALLVGQAYAHLGRTDDARRFLHEALELSRGANPKITSLCESILRSLP
jgi:Flp pilus assembly protein TadD